jgi:hypothetical protein
MRAPRETFLFAGPTLGPRSRALARAANVRLKPPARRLDVATLVARSSAPGVILVADGVFHAALAVGHAEIRNALEKGWRVWGVASMGAIRAREMQSLGMRGYGRVFERYAAEGDFQDDEVALVHEASAPHRALTEPLVHLREALSHLTSAGIVDRTIAHEVEAELKRCWFGDRTIAATIRALTARGADVHAVRAELVDFDRFRVKTLDLDRFLVERPWVEVGPPWSPPTNLDVAEESRTTHSAREGRADFTQGRRFMAAKKSKKVTIEIDAAVLADLTKAVEALEKFAIAAHTGCDDPKVRGKLPKKR